MSQTVTNNVRIAAPSSFDKFERACVGLTILNQILGLFQPPEAFLLGAANYSQMGSQVAAGPLAYPITSMISHAVEALALLLVVRHWRAYLGILGRGAPVLLQAALFGLTTLWSVDQTESIRATLHLMIDCVLAVHIVHSYSVNGLVRYLVRLFGIVALASFFMLLVFPGLSHEFGDSGFGADWRGALATKNALGAIASIGIITSGYSLLVGANDRRLAVLVLLANIVLVAGSRSATGVIVTAVCLGVLVAVYSLRSVGGTLTMTLLGFGVFCFLAAALSTVDHPAALLGKNATLTGRTGVWQSVMPLIKDRLLTGYGLGFWVVDTDYRNDIWLAAGWKTPYAHNDIIDVLLQTGVVGACLFVFNYVLSFLLGVRRLWRFEEGHLFCLLIVLNFAVRGLTETVNLPPGDTGVALLYVAQIYLLMISFPSRSQGVTRHASAVGNSPNTTLSGGPQGIVR